MKLSVMQENLARGLSVVSRAVSARATLPVLGNVLLKTDGVYGARGASGELKRILARSHSLEKSGVRMAFLR